MGSSVAESGHKNSSGELGQREVASSGDEEWPHKGGRAMADKEPDEGVFEGRQVPLLASAGAGRSYGHVPEQFQEENLKDVCKNN
jgi:hypothetical protein